MALDSRCLDDVVHIGGNFRTYPAKPPLLLLGTTLARLRLIPRFRLTLGTEARLLHAVGGKRILGQARPTLIDLHAIRVFEYLDLFSLVSRNPVVVGVQGHVAILVRFSLVHLVGSWKVRRQWIQVTAFVLESLRRNQSRLGHRTMLHPHRGPLQCLPVQILQALERATGQEVGLRRSRNSFRFRLFDWDD